MHYLKHSKNPVTKLRTFWPLNNNNVKIFRNFFLKTALKCFTIFFVFPLLSPILPPSLLGLGEKLAGPLAEGEQGLEAG